MLPWCSGTTDHDYIRHWVEERGGHPAAVQGTGGGDDAGILRIDFPGYSGEGKLESIGWDEFFAKFEESQGMAGGSTPSGTAV